MIVSERTGISSFDPDVYYIVVENKTNGKKDKMLGTMAIIDCKKYKEVVYCQSIDCESKDFEEEYLTHKEFYAQGWIKTNNEKYCPPGVNHAWLCPICAKKEGWTKE